jgi:RNA polymerase sigma factor (sigma-70 family)
MAISNCFECDLEPLATSYERNRQCQRVIELRFADEKSIREIAEELGRSEGAVKQLQFRAIQNLRERMGRKNG